VVWGAGWGSLHSHLCIRRFDIVRDALSKIFQNDVHSDPEALHVLSSMLDVPVNRFLGDDLKPKAFVFHIHRQFHAAQSIGLPDLVQLDSVASTTHLLAPLSTVDVVANPPDVRTGLFSKTPRSFFSIFLGMGLIL
jgi:hypothetical protein